MLWWWGGWWWSSVLSLNRCSKQWKPSQTVSEGNIWNTPCSTPSAQVRILQEFQPALRYLHNTITHLLSTDSNKELKHTKCTRSLTNEDVYSCDNDGHGDASQQDVILLRGGGEKRTMKYWKMDSCSAWVVSNTGGLTRTTHQGQWFFISVHFHIKINTNSNMNLSVSETLEYCSSYRLHNWHVYC